MGSGFFRNFLGSGFFGILCDRDSHFPPKRSSDLYFKIENKNFKWNYKIKSQKIIIIFFSFFNFQLDFNSLIDILVPLSNAERRQILHGMQKTCQGIEEGFREKSTKSFFHAICSSDEERDNGFSIDQNSMKGVSFPGIFGIFSRKLREI